MCGGGVVVDRLVLVVVIFSLVLLFRYGLW